MRSRALLSLCALALVLPCSAAAQDASDTATSQYQALKNSPLLLQFGLSPDGPQLPTPECMNHGPWDRGGWFGGTEPCSAEEHAAWLASMRAWKAERRVRVGYSGERYALPALRWTQSSYIQPQMMIEDRYFYDKESGQYTVDRYLDDLQKRYGGIDAVLVWPTYPNIGVDDRNQLDMVRSMPGGVEGVKRMVADFHRRGVRVFFPMMMWDHGTHDPGEPWPDAIAKLMKEIGADGINGDTQDGVPSSFSLASDRTGHPLAFEPENGPADSDLGWNLLTWGQYQYPFAPQVDRYKWLETRHQVNISDRWKQDKTDNLQFAFFNGVGWESWENVWGIWNGITPRDAEATRRVATLERGLSAFLVSPEWEPLYPVANYGVFASEWPLEQQSAWTVINRNGYDIAEVSLPLKPSQAGMRFYDLYHGEELHPVRRPDGTLAVTFPVEAHGYGAVLASESLLKAQLSGLMQTMHTLTATPLSTYSHEWKALPQTMVSTEPAVTPHGNTAGMVRIAGGPFDFRVNGIELEGFDTNGVDVQYPWEASPRRFHAHTLQMDGFWMDRYPVTNADFKRFLDAAHYRPKDSQNFLHDWKNGNYPSGWANKPVTWVSLEDARAYASWAGKRLPHEWEWQYAAQGNDGRAYPWGNEPSAAAVPTTDTGRTIQPAADVDAHPHGASQSGVMDLVGNVWQWTDEFQDDHTRAAVLRGGSHYQPQGGVYYFPQTHTLNEHGKLLLMAPGRDRSATIGFRCVLDGKREGR